MKEKLERYTLPLIFNLLAILYALANFAKYPMISGFFISICAFWFLFLVLEILKHSGPWKRPKDNRKPFDLERALAGEPYGNNKDGRAIGPPRVQDSISSYYDIIVDFAGVACKTFNRAGRYWANPDPELDLYMMPEEEK